MTMSSPLAGRRVVVTQAAQQAPKLIGLLERAGATALLYPCIAFELAADTTELDQTLRGVAGGHFDWLVLTSANTVRVISERAKLLGLPQSIWRGVHIAAIGAATEEAVISLMGCRAVLAPDESMAEGLAESLLAVVGPKHRLLLPQADIARAVLVESLAAAGLDVVQVIAYHTVLGKGGVDLAALLAESPVGVDAITFTSSSTVRNLLRRLDMEGGDCMRLAQVCLAAIGPITTQTMQKAGLCASVIAQQQSVEGLVEALIKEWE